MRGRTAAFDAAVVDSHTRVARVALLAADLSVDDILEPETGYAIDGSVGMNPDRGRTCQLSFANPAGLWTPASAADPLYPNRLLRLERGIMVASAPEYVTLGTFVIDRPVVNVDAAGATLTLTAQDRVKFALRSRWTKPTTYPKGMGVADVVQAIAQDAGMGRDLYRLNDGGKALAAARTFDVGIDRWPSIVALARDYALQVYADADGYLVLEPAPSIDAMPAPAWRYAGGDDAMMLGVTKDWNDDRLFNHALVSGEGADLRPVSAEARDLNPASPAYNPPDGSGPIGDRLYTYTSALIRTKAQAQEVADALLPTITLIEEAVSVPAIVHPALEVGDVVGITEPLSRTDDDYWIDNLTIPLGAGAMTLTARKLRSLVAA
jgi:hypothetical protein